MSSEDKAIRWRTELALVSALLGFAMLPMPAAEAQYAPWSYPYYDGYPAPMPPGRVAAGEMAPPPSMQSSEAYGVLPSAEIRRRVAALGFHLIAAPRRKGRIYLAEAEDVHGLTHRLVFDAYRGNIVENTKLAVLPRKPKFAGIAGEAKPDTQSVQDKAVDKKAPLRTVQ
jgi:hypothetical protein